MMDKKQLIKRSLEFPLDREGSATLDVTYVREIISHREAYGARYLDMLDSDVVLSNSIMVKVGRDFVHLEDLPSSLMQTRIFNTVQSDFLAWQQEENEEMQNS